MSLFLFLTVVQAIVAAALVGVVLMQRSEGGGLGIGGGSPGGLMGARGAADFLTHTTKWLAVAFVALSIALAAVAVETSGTEEITSTVDRSTAPAAPASAPAQSDPLAAPSGQAGGTPESAPADNAPSESDPLAR